MFNEATFDGMIATATFDETMFGDGDVGRTKFYNKTTSFSRPQASRVSFDWDHFPEQMTACTSPTTWRPPLLVES